MSADALPAGWPQGTARLMLDSVDSTNAHAARIAGDQDGPVWVVAAEQTEGRGRRGRPWTSPRGNLYATLLLRPQEAPQSVALRSFAAALALYDTCAEVTGVAQAFGLKWPNDVLLNGGKLAGILLESSGQGGSIAHLCVGIGVNLINAPEASQTEPGALPAVSLLAETGKRVTPDAFLNILAPAYAKWEHCFRTEGFAPLRTAWLARATRLGETIKARTGTETRSGIFETIDESGALVLNTAKGRIAISAAEIFF